MPTDIKPCPKCGGEMDKAPNEEDARRLGIPAYSRWYCTWCGHEEKVKN